MVLIRVLLRFSKLISGRGLMPESGFTTGAGSFISGFTGGITFTTGGVVTGGLVVFLTDDVSLFLSVRLITGFVVAGFFSGFTALAVALLKSGISFFSTLLDNTVVPYPQSPSWLGAGTQVPSNVCTLSF